MTTETIDRTGAAAPVRTGHRTTAVLFTAGGLLTGLGVMLHPHGSGATVDAHLLSMFDSPTWLPAHLVLLTAAVVSTLAFAAAARERALPAGIQRWLGVVMVGWAFGAVEQVPHLLAAGEAQALADHRATPVLDLHVLLQVVASPPVGVTGALVAVWIALDRRTPVTWVLARFGILGGLLYAAAGPLVVLTGDPAYTVLFSCQLGLVVWLTGTGVQLLRGTYRTPGASTHSRMV